MDEQDLDKTVGGQLCPRQDSKNDVRTSPGQVRVYRLAKSVHGTGVPYLDAVGGSYLLPHREGILGRYQDAKGVDMLCRAACGGGREGRGRAGC